MAGYATLHISSVKEEVEGIGERERLKSVSKFVLVLVLFYLFLSLGVRTLIEYCITVALIPIRMYINLLLYY